MDEATSAEAVMKKALDILKGELNREEYLTYLETITPKIGDATRELREKTKKLALRTVLKEAKKFRAKGT
jgi:lactate dehydrogenase-like 2-hydroxyacid dehydrogenase